MTFPKDRLLVFDIETKPFRGKRERKDFEIACAVTYEPHGDRWGVYVAEDALLSELRNGHKPLKALAHIDWSTTVVVGHSLWHNDLPILRYNLERVNETLPEEVQVIDTQRVIERAGGGCLGMDRIGMANFGAKRDESGRDASLAWGRGNHEVTIDHCLRDVRLTAQLLDQLVAGSLIIPPDNVRLTIPPDLLAPEVWRMPEKKKRRRRGRGTDTPVEDGAASGVVAAEAGDE